MATSIFQTFGIVLDSPTGSYFPGNTVRGRVIVETAVQQRAMGFELNCSGTEFASWYERDCSRRDTIYCYQGKEHFNFKILLGPINGIAGMPDLWLHPGRTEFPFQFALPLGLTSSFEQDSFGFCYIRYNIQARLNNHEVNCMYTMNAILDLNNLESAGASAKFDAEKYIGCCCCESGPISFILRKDSYYTAESSRERGPHKKVIEFLGAGVAAGQTGTYRPDPNTVKIPSLAPTDLGGSRIINIQYILEVALILPCGYSNLKAEIPITIGTIPFRHRFSQLMPPGGVVSEGTATTEQLLILYYPDLR